MVTLSLSLSLSRYFFNILLKTLFSLIFEILCKYDQDIYNTEIFVIGILYQAFIVFLLLFLITFSIVY